MKCPKCGFNSFDYLSACKRCGNPLEPNPMFKAIHESITEAGKQKSAKVDENVIEKPLSSAVFPVPDLSHAQALSRISNEPKIRSISTEMSASGENKEEEDEVLNLSIPSDFLPYKSLFGESQQVERVDMVSPVPFTSPVYNPLSQESQFKEETISFDLA